MKDLIKKLLREGLNEQQLEEGKFRNAVAGGLMGLGALAGGQAQAQDAPKPQTAMFGSAEQRAAKKAQRDAHVKELENNYIKGAVNNNFFEPIDDREFQQGLVQTKDTPFYERKFTYTEMGDGTKIKVFLKKYSQFIEKRGKQPDADRTYGAGANQFNSSGERTDCDSSSETGRKHCTGSAEGHRQKAAVQSGQNKT